MRKVFLLPGILLLYGCASVPLSLTPEKIKATRTIAFVTEPVRQSPEILNHTEIASDSNFIPIMFGLAGALVESAIISSETQDKIKESLGGDPKLFLEETKSSHIQPEIDLFVARKLSTGFSVISPDELKRICQTKESDKRLSIKNYLKAARQTNADVLISLTYMYGIAGYAKESSSAAIDGDYFVYDVRTGKKLVQKKLFSDHFFRAGHKLNEFLSQDAELFKQDLKKASEGMATLIASEWHLFVDEAKEAKFQAAQYTDVFARNKIPTDYMSTSKVDCNNPVKLTQSCSNLTGASKRIRIDGKRVSIAGSDDGKKVLVMWGTPDKLVSHIKNVADEHHIVIEKVTKFGMQGDGNKFDGFIIYADADLYSELCRYGY